MCANVWMHTHAQACPFCLRCTRLFAGTQTRHEYLKGFSLHALHICHHQSLKSLLEGRGPCEEHMCVCVCVWQAQSGHLHISCSSSLPRALLLSSVCDEHPQDLSTLHPLICVCVFESKRRRKRERTRQREHYVYLLCLESRSVG